MTRHDHACSSVLCTQDFNKAKNRPGCDDATEWRHQDKRPNERSSKETVVASTQLMKECVGAVVFRQDPRCAEVDVR